jgi:two-component system, NtrC family, response regulator HydG
VVDSPVMERAGPTSAPAAGGNHLVGRPLAEVERYMIEEGLKLTGGNREEAAKMLGIGERTLYRKIQEWRKEDQEKVKAGAEEG